jgi:hypothetical protein
MNRLDPDLKRLLRESVPASSKKPTDAPFGFSGRIVANWSQNRSEPIDSKLNPFFGAAAWMSCLIIVGCGLFFAQQTRTPQLAADFTYAAQFLANTFAP